MATCAFVMEYGETSPQNIVRVAMGEQVASSLKQVSVQACGLMY